MSMKDKKRRSEQCDWIEKGDFDYLSYNSDIFFS